MPLSETLMSSNPLIKVPLEFKELSPKTLRILDLTLIDQLVKVAMDKLVTVSVPVVSTVTVSTVSISDLELSRVWKPGQVNPMAFLHVMGELDATTCWTVTSTVISLADLLSLLNSSVSISTKLFSGPRMKIQFRLPTRVSASG